jgi:hypothetical protein
MQVFLPDSNFATCAEVLDTKRLVKQLLEGRQIMTILANESPSGAWRNHPAVKMFKGYERTLYSYLFAIKDEMVNRGYKWQTNWEVIQDTYIRNFINQKQETPEWMLNNQFESVIITHRGRLHAKAPELYPQYEKEYNIHRDYVCCERCNYYWVTHDSVVK